MNVELYYEKKKKLPLAWNCFKARETIFVCKARQGFKRIQMSFNYMHIPAVEQTRNIYSMNKHLCALSPMF